MTIEKRNDLGQIIYSVMVSLNRIDLSEYSGLEGDFGEAWELVLGTLPLKRDSQKSEVEYLIHEALNPNGHCLKQSEVDSTLRRAIDNYLIAH